MGKYYQSSIFIIIRHKTTLILNALIRFQPLKKGIDTENGTDACPIIESICTQGSKDTILLTETPSISARKMYVPLPMFLFIGCQIS